MNYSDKLKDPRWQKKRLEILNRDRFTCLACGDTKNTLHVHHCYYVSKREPWDYPNESLLTFCAKCHKGVDEDKESTAHCMAKAWEFSAGSEVRRWRLRKAHREDYAWDEGVMWALEECWMRTAPDEDPAYLMDDLVRAATLGILTPDWTKKLRDECQFATSRRPWRPSFAASKRVSIRSAPTHLAARDG